MEPEEFRQAIYRERQYQAEIGYDIKHDDEHGVDHLLQWAQEYVRQGKLVQAAALIEAAREVVIEKNPAEDYEYMVVNFKGIGLYTAPNLETALKDIRREHSDSDTKPIRRIRRRRKAGGWEEVDGWN